MHSTKTGSNLSWKKAGIPGIFSKRFALVCKTCLFLLSSAQKQSHLEIFHSWMVKWVRKEISRLQNQTVYIFEMGICEDIYLSTLPIFVVGTCTGSEDRKNR